MYSNRGGNKDDCNDRDTFVASYQSDDPDFVKAVVEKALNSGMCCLKSEIELMEVSEPTSQLWL